MTDKEFERQVARIVWTLEATGATVKWNDRIPDPDNPRQRRQIDVTVKRESSLTIVECRLHSEPQNVKWIEELVGRRLSLGADSVIAVSSSGFTNGAKLKAERFGIFLRTLTEVSDDEVRSWGARTEVLLWYVKFSDLRLYAVAGDEIVIPTPADALRTDKFGEFPLDETLRGVSSRLSQAKLPEGPVTFELKPKGMFLGSLPLSEAYLALRWKWYVRKIALPTVWTYHAPGKSAEATVLKNSTDATELIHADSGGTMMIDISGAPLEQCCYLRRVTIDHGKPMPMRAFGLIGAGARTCDVCSYAVQVIRRSQLPKIIRDASPL